MHIIDVGTGKRVEFPIPNDGSMHATHLNQEHAKIMSSHLRKEVEEAEYVENRMEESIKEVCFKLY
jgi:hypothetical protein